MTERAALHSALASLRMLVASRHKGGSTFQLDSFSLDIQKLTAPLLLGKWTAHLERPVLQ